MFLTFLQDYNLDENQEPLVFYVLERMRELNWTGSHGSNPDPSAAGGADDDPSALAAVNRNPGGLRVTIGHCNRLCLFTTAQWIQLKDKIYGLPVYFVDLPQSSIYMMGRPDSARSSASMAPRGSLDVPWLNSRIGMHVAMGVNNVQNAFTPQGSVDPLSLCTLAAGLHQCANPRGLRALLVSFV